MKTLMGFVTGLGIALCAAAAPGVADTLRIGTEAAYKPFAYVLPSGELTGFDIDITKALCAAMEADCEIVNQSFDGLIPALNSKKIDAIIASMSITEDRLKAIDFAGPYYITPALFVAAEGSDVELTPEGMDGKFVGVQRGTTMADYVKEKFPDARSQFYDTLEAATLDLSSGRVDLVFADSVVIDEFLASGDGKGFTAVGEPVYDSELLGGGAGIGIRKGDDALKKRFDDALAKIIASGEYKQINEKYLSVSILPH
ncbi:transporter substrate-binding domain-containing protein [Amaricoccus solimangrovi]|uniref:Transporter substrate-binding domain-containing protein n=1 Tax=Amaricoccus solimangrovi TaxID=2589815 RepID=A0A501WUT4_9RHOB|nr:transporter substrate-binding domain-containing protein [Amaricoccus solimangrovi]TPE50711.1 transporter substrate-binding domain-containing protein [Amaricoccus solimangrovi]